MQSSRQAPHGIVYVGANDPRPGRNAVLAYRRDEDGQLTLLGSYPTGGTGFANPSNEVGPDDSDQNVVVNAEATLLFAVNGGSDSIAAFGIGDDGSLTPVPGSPVASGGVQPVSLGLADDHLYVVNKSHDPTRPESAGRRPSYGVFSVGPDGQLSAVPDATVAAEPGVSPAQALVSRDGRFLFGAEPFGGALRAFGIGADGRLQPRPATAVDAPHPAPVGLAVHPEQPVLYVGLPTRGQLAVYTYDSDGALTLAGSAPNSGRALCWIVTNRAGDRVYTVSNASNSVSLYDTSDALAPAEIQSIALDSQGGAFQEALDPGERFLHVVTANGTGQRPEDNSLHTLAVASDGTLGRPGRTVLPVPAAAHPAGVACI
jgi:6-phosphogluconolactonase (cycloisomerase 2 family)